ncbi:hypothetical protein [Sphingomonas abietis]|uniref:Lipoprotein n=1 Tax=Sphingomonas abietis TaxID=3012344 RepID=A0ABY7NQP9_9SPHN|nr:hypothetical protein [Sphingomonas abietis]WBO23522.1 hypothetical protein PBT88_05175 [Sphingomonas abietis]
MVKTGMAAAAVMAILVTTAGCHRTAEDIGNSARVAAHDASRSADALADRADQIGDRASNRIDDAGAQTTARIDRANERLGRLVAPGTPTDRWIGRWRGVEGLTLVIARDAAKGPGHYRLTDQYTLDDRGVFAGRAIGDTIQFTRPDGDQVLRAGNGAATGLKYLATKKDCLTVKPGEGYCRD